MTQKKFRTKENPQAISSINMPGLKELELLFFLSNVHIFVMIDIFN